MLDRVFQKIGQAQATGILIVPNWSTQPWFPTVQKIFFQEPALLNLSEAHSSAAIQASVQHPLSQKLQLMACI